MPIDMILHHGRITTQDSSKVEVSAVAIRNGLIEAIGSNDEILTLGGPQTQKIDLNNRRVIPGLNDSHLHVIRAGSSTTSSFAGTACRALRRRSNSCASRPTNTPPPQWVRVIGGWNEFQFAEGRMPTLDEINKAAPDTPVFVLHLYDSALLESSSLRVLGFDKNTPNPPGGLIARDAKGNPTGLLIAEPSALILYSTIANAPKLSFEDQLNSTRHYMRELNRFGVTSVSDAGGGGQNYPDDYAVVKKLDDDGQLTVRIAYSLFAQKPGQELADYTRWLGMTQAGRRKRFAARQWRRREFGVERRRLRKLSSASTGPATRHGKRTGADRPQAGRSALAVADSCHVRRVDRPISRHLRARASRHADRRAAMVH